MRVLHVLPAVPFGGMQKFAVHLAAEQRAQGIDVSLLAIYACDALQRLAADLSVPIRFVAEQSVRVSSLPDLYGNLRRAKADVVHVHALLSWVLLTSRFANRGIWVLHVHSYPGALKAKERLNWRMARGVFDQVICVSNSVHTAIQPLIGRLPCTVVPNGTAIPPKQDRQPHGPSPVFGIAMRLNADKGALCIPDIAQELAAQCPGAKLLIAGDGDAAAKLSLLIRSHHLSDVAVQLGYCAEMADFWSRVDVSLFISPRDTFGLTIIESMAHGVPVVGFRSGAGSDEVLLQTDRDFVVESGQPRQLVRTALELYRNQSRMDNFRTCGMTLVQERYSISAVTARVAEIYREMPR